MSTAERHAEAWSAPPLDNVGYIPSAEMLTRTDAELRLVADDMRKVRYEGERNHDGLWRDILGLDVTINKRVLDYGCGNGIESLEYGRTGNKVTVVDIAPDNIRLARRMFDVHGCGHRLNGALVARIPLSVPDNSFDVIHCSGVLHHIADPYPVVEDFHRMLKADGELRLMLYSDIGWAIATGTAPSHDLDDITGHPGFKRFVRHFDSVGEYADWYDVRRVTRRFGRLFTVVRSAYLMPNGQYIGMVLRPKGK